MSIKKKIGTTLLVLVFVGLAGTTGFLYYKYQKAQYALNNPQKIAQDDVKALVAKVGKHIELPTDEDPNVATVLDITKLKDQPFFAHAQNGDKVLIYTKSAKAILYREAEDKIIDVAPITLTQPQASATPTPTPTATPKVSVKASPKP